MHGGMAWLGIWYMHLWPGQGTASWNGIGKASLTHSLTLDGKSQIRYRDACVMQVFALARWVMGCDRIAWHGLPCCWELIRT
ncbi:hypothetical protein BKA65DRAFT_486471 [Rhexocercosporidium sp. MPI-PUGE-AT-0058]|nr:hypothetical protein BKA65DRAFT_486471 [Rhexocercosporidium sp. MPI-PUGE-AT-0058]